MTYSPARDDFVARARAVTVGEAADRLGLALRRAGTERVGPCPVCGGTDRFAIAGPGKNAWNCRHCGGGRDGISLAMHARGDDFLAACSFLLGEAVPGQDGKSGGGRERSAEERAARDREIAARRAKEAEEAEALARREALKVAEIVAGTRTAAMGDALAGYWYDARRLKCAIPPDIRLHPALPYWLVGPEKDDRPVEIHRGPAMVGLIRDAADLVIGVHLTWIDLSEEKGKVRLVDGKGAALPAKKMRGRAEGGAIWLARPEDARFGLCGEGIETTATVLGAYGDKQRRRLAAAVALSLGNMAGRAARDADGRMLPDQPDMDAPGFVFPAAIDRAAFLGDGDSEPEFTKNAVMRAARRFVALRPGRTAKMSFAPAGKDFNDLAVTSSREGEGGDNG